MNHHGSFTAAVLSLACCACSSAPVRYYTLTRPSTTPGAIVSTECCQVELRRVIIPAEVDRPEIVTRSGEDQAMVLGNALWLAPLREEIRSALISRIESKLHEEVAATPAKKASGSVVTVTVTRFESVTSQYVTVAVNWRIRRADQPPAQSFACETTAQLPVQSGVSAAVQGYQQALALVADQIATEISRLGSDAEQGC
jgi:hypothetical protein